jgi:amino acid adenylation domain-containing protein/thioester reductase-like protein
VTVSDSYVVLVNDMAQHALWPAATGVPGGWRPASGAMTRSECLALVERSWPDLAPASITPGSGAPRPTGAPAPGGPLVHELVAAQAARQPDALAASSGRGRLTYRELDESSSRLARYLASIGAGPEALVGVCLERGIDLIRVMLAVMKSGAGYLPLDPALPPERLAATCVRVRPLAVIAAGTGATPAAPPAVAPARLLRLDELSADLERHPPVAPDARPHRDNVCYVIHTSGTSGAPKAVAVSYGSLAWTIPELARAYGIGPGDRVTQFASPAFDTSVEQVLTALAGGAAVLVPPPGVTAPSHVLRGIERKQVTVVDLTPAYWHQVLAHTEPEDERLRSVRLMITGGEMASRDDCAAALRAAPWARLLNAYGLTETTITSALYDVGGRPLPPGPVPAGTPLRRARVMITGENLEPAAPGAAGEICIGGGQVARGYLGQPGLTAERFVPDPGGAPGARMYRTGDRGRWLPDGSLEVAGRLDRQLKVRGFRVEPAEIEAVLAGHPDIAEAQVTATAGEPGGNRLVAHYTPRATAGTGTGGGEAATAHPPAASLRRYLLDRLPGYMIPAAFIPRRHQRDGTPLDGTRLDGTRLDGTAPDGATRGNHGNDGERPAAGADGQRERQTPTEAGIATLWGRLLHRDRVDLDDDFFALGGNSLLAAEMLAHVQAIFGIAPDCLRPLTRRLLREPTLSAFAAAAREARAGTLCTDGDLAGTDFTAEAALDLTVHADGAPGRPRPDWRDPGDVLLTGAAGFLGAHLLSDLIATTRARVWCLVRAAGADAARARIAAAAERYQLPAPPAGRVVPLPGDLTRPDLGLPAATFRDLAGQLDVIYHVGAQVNFIYPYQELRAANVGGTREVIRLASLQRAIPVHYVSTTAVLAGLGMSGVHEVTEETPLAHPEQLRMGYVETKYVAEEMLRHASRAGLPVAIYRPLDIVGSAATGAWSTTTEMCAVIRFMTDTGLAPDIDLPLDFVAADACAAAIRQISLTAPASGRTYHLATPKHTTLAALVDRLRMRGYHIGSVPFTEWTSELARLAARDPSHPMTAFLPLFVDRDPGSGLTVAEMYLANVFPAYGAAATERALLGSGITFAPVSGQLMDRNIDRLIETGYLSAPPGPGGRR